MYLPRTTCARKSDVTVFWYSVICTRTMSVISRVSFLSARSDWMLSRPFIRGLPSRSAAGGAPPRVNDGGQRIGRSKACQRITRWRPRSSRGRIRRAFPMYNLPTHISRYEIKSRIGRGGMGDLYLALDPNTGRLVALKLLNTSLDSTELRERFAREARALAALNHTNIVN